MSSTPPDAPALDLRQVSRRYGNGPTATLAVDDLSLTLPRGELLALLGPNGAGKTSTVDLCEGFARPDGGSVSVLGLDPWREADKLRPRIGVMLQAGGAHLSARVGEMLDLVAATSAHPLDTRWLLDVLGLADATRTPIRRLSGGQVQRLSLAMALVGRPEVLFLDEPTAGMDPQARHLVWDLLTAAKADGVAILLTTHLLDEAELLADRIVIIDHGRTVASGSTAELTAGGEHTLHFSAPAGLALTSLLAALPEGFTAAEARPGRYRIEGDITPGTLATVTSWCAGVGVMPTGLDTHRRRLEDVYLDLTGRQVRS